MTNKEFDLVKSKFENSLEELIEACELGGFDILDEVADVLANYDIEL